MEKRIAELGKVVEEMTPHVVFTVGPVEVTSTVISAWVAMAILFLFIFIITRNLKPVPETKRQLLAELILVFLYGMLDELVGKKGRKFVFLSGTMFLLILFMNLSWFIPELTPATIDLSATVALGLVAILGVQAIGIQQKGLKKYLKHYISPTPAMLPMNIIEELVKPFSLGLRLFGNMFGEEMVVLILFILVPLLLPVPIQLMGVLMGSIQAYVFSLLTALYIAGILGDH
ncbi:F0F1 ATP synthase subunit A [Clostridia bacterium]|nr:F0F1 ATP synthase subunit A [Clostridia bacterium]